MSIREQTGVVTKSALFVFNKWDQVPPQEVEEVKRETLKALSKSWPNLDPDSQVIYFSTKKAALAQSYGIVSQEFAGFLRSIESLVLRSMVPRVEVCARWLVSCIGRLLFYVKARQTKANKSYDEKVAEMRSVLARLDNLEKDQEKVVEELEEMLGTKTAEAIAKLAEYVNSRSFRDQCCSWTDDEAPPPLDSGPREMIWKSIQYSLENRVTRLIQVWEEEQHVFSEARKSLVGHFISKFQQFEQEIAALEDEVVNTTLATSSQMYPEDAAEAAAEADSSSADLDVIALTIPGVLFFPLNLAATLLGGPGLAMTITVKDDHPKLFWGTSVLWGPFAIAGGILAIPTYLSYSAIEAAKEKLHERHEQKRIAEYEANKGLCMRQMSPGFLSRILDDGKFVHMYGQILMTDAESCLKEIKARIPELIKMDRRLCHQLKKEKRSERDILKVYNPIEDRCKALESRLDLFLAA